MLRQVHDRFAIAACATDEFEMRLGIDRETEKQDVDGSTLILAFNSVQNEVSLARLHAFATTMRSAIRRHPSKTIVLCIGRDNSVGLNMAAVLLGGFLILEEQVDINQIAAAFQSVDSRFDRESVVGSMKTSVHDCWRAISHAKSLEWTQLFCDTEMIPDPH